MNKLFKRVIPLLLLGVLAVAVQAAPHDVMLVVDNSGSMRKVDPSQQAKRAASEFLQKLPEDFNVGVIIFDQSARLVMPLTPATAEGRAKLAESLGGMNYRGQFTDSPAAIERAIFELKTKARPDVSQTIVFVSDGVVDTGAVLRDTERGKWLREELSAEAAASGIRIMPIAFTENADLLLIERLADITKGESIRAVSPDDLSGAYGQMLERLQALAPMSAPPEPTQAPIAESPAQEVPLPEVAPPTVESTPSAAALEPMPTPEFAPPAPPVPPAEAPIEAPVTEADAIALTADEKAALEQLAKDTGVSVEQLMKELEEAPPGQAVVVRPEDIVTADGDGDAAQTNKLLRNLLFGAVGGGLLLAGLAWFFLRGKRAKPTAAPTVTASAAAPAITAPAEAFLIDVHGITSDPARRIGERQLIVGRTAGTDTESLDYFVVNKATIGRRHAIIKFKDHAFWLVDQGSVNGTFVNHERVVGERMLKHGDRVKFHKFEFEFSYPDMADSNKTVIGSAADQTIVAAQDATLNASSVALRAETAPFAPASKTAAVVATGAAATGAWLNKGALDRMPDEGGDEDPFDITEEGDLNALEADRDAFFGGSGSQIAFPAPPEIGGGDDTFDDEAAGTIALAGMQPLEPEGGEADRTTVLSKDITAMPSDALGLDADASAFFDEGTVGPASDLMRGPTPDLDADLDVLDITKLPGGVGDDDLTSNYSPPDSLMRAPRLGERTYTKSPLDTGSFGELTTLARNMDESHGPDMSLDDFNETGTFETSGTLQPEPGSHQDTTVMQSNPRGEDIFDVTGSPGDIPNQETVVLDDSPLHAKKGADPTLSKPRKPRK